MQVDDIKQKELTQSERDVLKQDTDALAAHGRRRAP